VDDVRAGVRACVVLAPARASLKDSAERPVVVAGRETRHPKPLDRSTDFHSSVVFSY